MLCVIIKACAYIIYFNGVEHGVQKDKLILLESDRQIYN